MRMYDLILKKKQGKELTKEEIYYMIEGFTKGDIPDYQMSAMTMAICFQGMSKRETVDLTLAMRDSGDVLNLDAIEGIKVDKHSTGGVGDKVSLVLTPMIAALGIPVAKMSGRGLGHTGGTIDKLESIEGFSTEMTEEVFIRNVNSIKVAIAGQTANLAPADKKLYALRDVTATVDQMSLIASSIMSKKLASGADAIVLDVKTGNGAFMQKEEDAVALAKAMVDIGKRAGKKTVALITDMDEPLGNAVGNALEVKEAIESLKGNGPADFMEVVIGLGKQMLVLAGRAESEKIAEALLKETIDSLEYGSIPYDDAMVLTYLTLKFREKGMQRHIKHVVIDEAQDYYPIQFEIIRMLFPNAKYTVLGDINQTLDKQEDMHFYTKVRERLQKKKYSLVTLTKSFRCTN